MFELFTLFEDSAMIRFVRCWKGDRMLQEEVKKGLLDFAVFASTGVVLCKFVLIEIVHLVDFCVETARRLRGRS